MSDSESDPSTYGERLSVEMTFAPSRVLIATFELLESQTIRLFCSILGEPLDQIFGVTIAWTASVCELKEAIKDEVKYQFEHIDANLLNLWDVSGSAQLSTSSLILTLLYFDRLTWLSTIPSKKS